MRLNSKPPACFTVVQAFHTHCFDYLYFEFRTVSSIWHSFWHVYSPLFYFITFVHLWGCSSYSVSFSIQRERPYFCFMRRSICVPWPGEDVPSPNAPAASVKKAGTAWEHWTSQIDDHLKPPTVAKRCTFRESRKSPALRGFVAGRWALATTSLYPSTKIERPQRAPNEAPWRRSSSGIGCLR